MPRWLLGGTAVVLLSLDLLFLASNLTKLVHARLPLAIAITAYTANTAMTTLAAWPFVTARREAMGYRGEISSTNSSTTRIEPEW